MGKPCSAASGDCTGECFDCCSLLLSWWLCAQEAYYQIKCLLGNPWALTPMESNALGAARNSVLAAGTVARAAATHPTNHPTNPLHNRTLDEPLVPAGDCHFKLLEAQLAFLCQLMAVGDAAEYPGFTWGAYVLPALHAVLLEGPDCGVLLDRGIAAQLQRVVEQEARLRIAAGCGNVAAPSQAAAPSQNIAAPSSKLWEQKTLLVHQVRCVDHCLRCFPGVGVVYVCKLKVPCPLAAEHCAVIIVCSHRVPALRTGHAYASNLCPSM